MMKRLARAPYLGALLLILTVKAVAMLWLILSGPIGLSPDEAQYWTWSQQLDYGYYSKPAAIAWEIALGTLLFGNSELGVRSGALTLALFLPLALYLLGRRCQLRPHAAFLAALTMVLTPLGILASILSITDTGMILFWIFACAVVARGIAKNKHPNYWLVGLFIALGALFKWPIYLLWVFIAALLPFEKPLRSRALIGGIFLSLLGLLPTLIWNAEHNWVSFLHVFQGVGGSDLAVKRGWGPFQGNFFDFWGAQLALASPVIFVLVTVALVSLIRNRASIPKPIAFCGYLSLSLLLSLGLLSLFKKVQGNWCDFAYPTAFILVGWLAGESRLWRRWLFGGLALSLVLTFFALAVPSIQSNGLFPNTPLPCSFNPFRHNVGWDQIAPQLERAGYDPSDQFLFSSSYQTTSLLNFYGPGQKRAYFFNLHGIRNNQFSLWPGMEEEQKGKSGYYVSIGQQAAPPLEPYFSRVTYLGSYPLFLCYDLPVKTMHLFYCEDYNGQAPPASGHY